MVNEIDVREAYGTCSRLFGKSTEWRKMERGTQDSTQIPDIEAQYAFITVHKSLLMPKPTKISSLIFCS